MAGVSIAASCILIASAVFTPYGQKNRGNISVHISPGDGLNVIAAKLERKDLIYSRFLFKWFSIALGNRKSYKSGEYLIKDRVSMLHLVKLLDAGSAILLKVTVPEGLRMDEIFNLFIKAGLINTRKLPLICRDREFIRSLGLKRDLVSLEGLLFPETYLFSKDVSEQTILRTMVRTFIQNIPEGFGKQAENVGLSFYEAVILASIIEKETSVANERKIIASVFHNRLKSNMRLQTDPTVIYGIKNFNGNLTRKQLRVKTPYNTYLNHGLPPTPIANPGLESLIAAVQPAKTDYLFFVARGDGTHKFTRNYKDHDQAVTEFQLKRRRHYKSY